MSAIPGVVIVAVVVGGAILLTISLTVRAVVQSVRRSSNSLAGKLISSLAEDILSGGKSGESILLAPSQEARSISDMTAVYARAIAADFPDLNLKQLISSAESKLCSALYAIQAGSAEALGTLGPASFGMAEDAKSISEELQAEAPVLLGVTPVYAALLRRRIDALTSEEKMEAFERIHIHRSGINKYEKKAGTCQITLQTAIEYLHYIKQNGVVVEGSQQTLEQARYNLLLLYVQDETKLASGQTTAIGMNCPNCGAPVKALGNRTCDFCGSSLMGIDIRVWRMDQFAES